MLKRLKMCGSLGFKLIRVFFQLIYGSWRVSKIPQPIISIFGGSRLPQHDKYARQADQIAQWFVENDISVLTGGGPGIMEAASCGAIKTDGGKGKSMGIGVRGLSEAKNPCVQEYFELDYFFARKWLLTRYSVGFVVFPGGFGTMDELAQVLTLIQTKKIKRVPIVLIGKEYWEPFLKWVIDEALDHGLVEKEHVELITLTDDPYEGFCLISDACKVK